MNSTKNYRLAEQLSVTEVDDEVVLLKLDTGSYYGLNPVGAQLVLGLQDEQTTHQICGRISQQFQTPYSTVKDDLDELIHQLLEQGLIEVCDPS